MTTKADTSVKWFHSGMADAPVLSATAAGSLINLLDVCLLNGFSVRTPDSIVVADGVATVSISAGNPYEKHAVVVISGVSNAALNAEWRIATSGASSFTFACPGVANGTVTGASVKRAAAGWSKPFSDTNKAAYQSLDPNSTQLYLQVDDTATSYSKVRGYEQMTSATAGTGLFPTTAQVADMRWPRNGGNTWAIIADGLFMWVMPKASNALLLNHFGDLKSIVPNDKYHCTLAAVSGTSTNGGSHPNAGSNSSTSYPRILARPADQVGSPIASFGTVFLSGSTNSWGGVSAASPSFDGAVRIGGSVLAINAGSAAEKVRGMIPGAVATIEEPVLSNFGVVEVGDDVYLSLYCHMRANSTFPTYGIFDIKGPWR